jgi:hypothetical protein
MKALRLDDFSGSVGQSYEVVVGDGTIELALEAADALPGSVREEGSFRLQWRGPVDPILPQAIYTLRREGEEVQLFIVPVGRDSSGTEYEAIFN